MYTLSVSVQDIVSSSTATSVSDIAKSETQSIQLEDGTTGFLNQAVKGKH